jgi:hypothetical protein
MNPFSKIETNELVLRENEQSFHLVTTKDFLGEKQFPLDRNYDWMWRRRNEESDDVWVL